MFSNVWAVVMRHWKVQALGVLLLVSLAAEAGYYMLAYRPAAAGAEALSSRLEAVKGKDRAVNGKIKRYEEFLEGRKKLEQFKSRLASRSEYTDVLKKVYDLARKDGMKGSSFGAQTSTLRQTGGLERMSFSLPVSGSYRAVRKFIYDVETSDIFLNIDDLGLSRGGTGDISLTIGLSTYVRS